MTGMHGMHALIITQEGGGEAAHNACNGRLAPTLMSPARPPAGVPTAFDHLTVDLDMNNFWVLQARWMRKTTCLITQIAYSPR